MKKNKGFTLVELLAVIIILAIIALIAVPVIMNIIDRARKAAFRDTVYGIIDAGEIKYASNLLDHVNNMEEIVVTFPDQLNGVEIKEKVPSSGKMIIDKFRYK